MFKKLGALFLEVVETLTTALAIFVFLYIFVGQHQQVQGRSMYPGLNDGDSLLVSKISYRLSIPKRGDIVVFKAPADPGEEYIKRIIGATGDKLEIQNNKIYINGALESGTFIPQNISTRPGRFLAEDRILSIPEGYYFVMGDNRPASSDSRDWGLVPRKNIIGKAVFRFWPPTQFGKL